MTRAAIMSLGGDVFLADFCLSLWENVWQDEVDVIYACYNNHAEVPLETSKEFLRKWESHPKIRIIYTPFGCGNGTPILQGLLNSKESVLLLLEDDSFIFTPHVVNEWFSYIEAKKADMVGSPRYAVGEIADAAKKLHNLDYSGYGDKGFGYWPSFFLCKREDLLRTDWRFASDEYKKGEYIKELDHTMENTEYTDTFTFASLQLRYMGLTCHTIPQNHTYPTDFEKNGKMFCQEYDNHEIKYLHGGSLSSGYGGYLNKKLPMLTTDMEKKDMETRVAFWKLVSDMTPRLIKGYDEFRKIYKSCIEALIINVKLDRDRIQGKYNGYKRIMNI